MQDLRMAALVEFWAERAIGSPAVSSTELARQISERAGADLKEGISPEQAGRLMARAIRLLETKGVYIEKRTEHNRASYQRVENPSTGEGRTPPTQPIESFSDGKTPGGVGGGVGVEYGIYSTRPTAEAAPDSTSYSTQPCAPTPPSSSDVKGGAGGVCGVVSEKSQSPPVPRPAEGEKRDRLAQTLKFQLQVEKRDEKDTVVLDVKRLLWGRALHTNCGICVSIEHHVCWTCSECAWQENHGGERAEAGT